MPDGFEYFTSVCSERHQDFDLNGTKMQWDLKIKNWSGFGVTGDPVAA